MANLKTWQPDEIFSKAAENMNPKQVDMLQKAYKLAADNLGNKQRLSGETYLKHATQVAGILADLNMDPTTITAGFLHDIVEDSDISLQDIKQNFGDDVSLIVNGVTKISKIKYNPSREQLSENYRKLLLVMCEDIRVMIVKLADRMDNMDTLSTMSESSQKYFSKETLSVYAPIADRLGMGSIKWELQDMALRYLNPDEYYKITKAMSSKRKERERYISDAIADIQKTVKSLDIDANVYGRPKHIYSIYKKMQDKNKKFEEIYDLSAVRVIVDSIKDCYSVLGAIHAKWKPMPGRFKDYIAEPKYNMYQSLHTTVIGPNGKPLEVQIRTKTMHRIAEYGVAAHWAYKKGQVQPIENDKNNSQLNWLKRIIEIQEETDNASDFMDSVKNDLFSDHVYAFTPNGDVIELPKGAGPLDMAFAIHTQVGIKTTGAKVNGKMVSLDDHIKNGDIVEIITSKNSKGPGRDWLELVHTSNAKHKIRNYLKKEHREENIKAGNEILENALKEVDFQPNDILTAERWNKVLDQMHYKDKDDLLAALGFGDIHETGVLNKFTAGIKKENENYQQNLSNQDTINSNSSLVPELNETGKMTGKQPTDNIQIIGIDNVLIHLAHCCLPVPGDKIVGYITKGHGITIHRANCNNIADYDLKKTIPANWKSVANNKIEYQTKLQIKADNRNGILNDVIKKINNSPGKLTSIDGKVHDDIELTISLSLNVKNTDEIKEVLSELKMIPGIAEINRVIN